MTDNQYILNKYVNQFWKFQDLYLLRVNSEKTLPNHKLKKAKIGSYSSYDVDKIISKYLLKWVGQELVKLGKKWDNAGAGHKG